MQAYLMQRGKYISLKGIQTEVVTLAGCQVVIDYDAG